MTCFGRKTIRYQVVLVLVRKLLLKTKIIFCATKIVVYCNKLTKILLKRRIEPIKPNLIKNNETTITIYKLAN